MLRAFSVTDIGKRRKVNQDCVFVSEQAVGNLANLFIVADGMGGHNAGDYAAKCAVETIVSCVQSAEERDPVTILGSAIGAANEHIKQKSEEDAQCRGMGTTVVAATFTGKQLQVANVGDSRLYVVNNTIRQITIDHSLVEEMVRIGGLDRKAARSHPDKNIITRAVGASGTVETDFFNIELNPEDMILMCSDGLTNMLEDEEIRRILDGEGDIREKAEQLVQTANQNGGNDNISVILIQFFAE